MENEIIIQFIFIMANESIKDVINTTFSLLDEDWKMELQKYQVSNINFSLLEKVIFGIEWLSCQIIGNGLLFGLIQFDRFGGDPLKRRITDQVIIDQDLQ